MSLGLKKGDTVEVITGKDRSTKSSRKRGAILQLLVRKGRQLVRVEGVNKVTKTMRKSEKSPQGEMIKIEMPIDVSNVMLVCPKCGKRTRIRAEVQDGKRKVRLCVKCRKVID